MHRLAASLLCAAVAFAAFAAPAPVYRTPRASEVWVKGWDEPLDPTGDSRFSRKGGRLALTVRGHRPGTTDFTRVPCLLREVEGDFDLRVRVGGDFGQRGLAADDRRLAGLVVQGDGGFVRFARSAIGGKSLICLFIKDYHPGHHHRERLSTQGTPPAHLHLVRRGDRLSFRSDEGVNWGEGYEESGYLLPRKVKVGVFAEATAEGTFEAVFDQFSLTTLK
jgi:hypothetical protein